MNAWCLVRPMPLYRRDAFCSGLKVLGYKLRDTVPDNASKGDAVVMWNRMATNHHIAERVERKGATVIVAENGYLNRGFNGSQWYALSRSHHNGAGWWPTGDSERWSGLGVQLKPWRADGSHILVLDSRGIGAPNIAQPRDWLDKTLAVLKRQKRKVIVRKHPGTTKGTEHQDLYAQLDGAWAAVTWGSGAGIKALAYGVPVFHGFAQWIGKTAARPFTGNVETPFTGDRGPMFQRLAHAMYSVEEIGSGSALRRFL